MRKGINVAKVVLIIIMLLGIGFSVSNFVSLELEAAPDRGVWVDLGSGVKECAGDGDECDILTGFEPNG